MNFSTADRQPVRLRKRGLMNTSAQHDRQFVLLTGSTGLVGGLMLAKLLSCGIPVAVLVRGNRRQSASERVESLMRHMETRFNRLFVRPVVLSGDLCASVLGLSEQDQRWITANCGSVVHSAASLSFRPASEHPDHEPYRTNLEGTRQLLEFTTRARITEWHFVSTAYLSGLRTGRILESECGVGQEFANDYERSKALSEDLLRQSGVLRSLTVYRPSIVIDLHPTASIKSDQSINTAFSMFQALSQRFGVPERGEWTRLLGFSGDERKNIVTVDWVANMIVEIYRRPALHGETYHLTSPNGTSATELDDSFRAAVERSGLKFPARRMEAMAELEGQAAPFVEAFKPYFRDDPQFDRTHVTRAMQVCDAMDVPVLTVEILRDFCLRQSKPVLPNQPVPVQKSAWQLFVEESQTRAACPVNSIRGGVPTSEHADTGRSPMVVELSGPGGGQWLVENQTDGTVVRCANGGKAAVRWIAAAETLDRLVDGVISVRDALESGILLIEFDRETSGQGPPIDSGVSLWIERFGRLIAVVQRHGVACRRQSSEAVHVG